MSAWTVTPPANGEAVFGGNLSMSVQVLPLGAPIDFAIHERRLIRGETDGSLLGVAVTGPMIFPDQIAPLGVSISGSAEWDGLTPSPAQTSGVMANNLGIIFESVSSPYSGIVRVTFDTVSMSASVDAPSGETASASFRLHAHALTGVSGVPLGFLLEEDITTTETVASVDATLAPPSIDIPFTLDGGSPGLLAIVVQAGGSAVSAFDGINVFTNELPETDVPLHDFTEIPEPTSVVLFGFTSAALSVRRHDGQLV